MVASALWIVIETLGGLLATACVLRAWSNWARVSPHNPLSQFAMAVTDWIVRPMRRVVPGSRGIDWSSLAAALLLALLVGLIHLVLFGGLASARVPDFGAVFLVAVLRLLRWSLLLLLGLTILQAVLSWVNPFAPIAPALEQLVRPFLAPIRRVVPLLGGVDLSPLVLLLGVQFLLMFIDMGLASSMLR